MLLLSSIISAALAGTPELDQVVTEQEISVYDSSCVDGSTSDNLHRKPIFDEGNVFVHEDNNFDVYVSPVGTYGAMGQSDTYGIGGRAYVLTLEHSAFTPVENDEGVSKDDVRVQKTMVGVTATPSIYREGHLNVIIAPEIRYGYMYRYDNESEDVAYAPVVEVGIGPRVENNLVYAAIKGTMFGWHGDMITGSEDDSGLAGVGNDTYMGFRTEAGFTF